MGSFDVLVKLEEDQAQTPEIVQAVQAANDNIQKLDGQLDSFRKALNTASLPEIKEMIQNEIINFNVTRKIELKINDEIRMLPEEMRHYLFEEILTAVLNNIPVALIGPAGSGKSTVGEQIAKALGLKFYLQNSVTGTHEVAGYLDANGRYNTTTFRTAFENGGLLFIDEVDTSDAGALKWLNTALANGYAMFPDKPDPISKHGDFRIIMAANTFGTGADRVYVGANQLDASTLDRFVFFDFNYDEKLELTLSGGNTMWARRVQNLRAAALKERARIVISPRATIYGAKLIGAGWKQEIVEERVIWKGIDPELKDRILKVAEPTSYKTKVQDKVEVKKKKAA